MRLNLAAVVAAMSLAALAGCETYQANEGSQDFELSDQMEEGRGQGSFGRGIVRMKGADRFSGAVPAAQQASPGSIDPSAAASPRAAGRVALAEVATDPSALDVLAQPGRKVIYTAEIGLRVANREEARRQVESLIIRMGGYMQNGTLEMITFRVPPARFSESLTGLEGIGEVVSKNVSSADVTEQYTDLELRISVAEKGLARLTELLGKAQKVEDILKIEQDIRRLTEEIERMKGQMRVMASRVDWSTVTVRLTERQPEKQQGPGRLSGDRFAWVRRVGVDQVQADMGTNQPTEAPHGVEELLLGREFDVELPEGFVALMWRDERLVATTPEDHRMAVTVFDVGQETGLDFWARTLEVELGQRRGYTMEKTESATAGEGMEARHLTATTRWGGEDWHYEAWLVRRTDRPDRMAVVELARPVAAAAQEGPTGLVAGMVPELKLRGAWPKALVRM